MMQVLIIVYVVAAIVVALLTLAEYRMHRRSVRVVFYPILMGQGFQGEPSRLTVSRFLLRVWLPGYNFIVIAAYVLRRPQFPEDHS